MTRPSSILLRETPAERDAALARLRAAMAAEVPASPPESTCSFCSEHIRLILGDWTDDDFSTACTDLSAPYVPHRPKEG